jgi:hypothetical protein
MYTAKTHTTDGRESRAFRSSGDYLEINLSTPGIPRIRNNPDQTFKKS